MTREYTDIWVCVDCYFAHHYGATRIERPATESEENAWLRGHDDRSIMGLEFTETDHGLEVVEWFADESDQRCEGGEPLRRLGDAEVSDNTCSNHNGTDETECSECGRTGYEDGMADFSWATCQGCGSHLGGSRYRLALWIKEDA